MPPLTGCCSACCSRPPSAWGDSVGSRPCRPGTRGVSPTRRAVAPGRTHHVLCAPRQAALSRGHRAVRAGGPGVLLGRPPAQGQRPLPVPRPLRRHAAGVDIVPQAALPTHLRTCGGPRPPRAHPHHPPHGGRRPGRVATKTCPGGCPAARGMPGGGHSPPAGVAVASSSVRAAQAYLGHSNPSTTLAVYCTPDFHQLVDLLRLPWLERGKASSGAATTAGDDTLLRTLAGGDPILTGIPSSSPPPPPPAAGLHRPGDAWAADAWVR